MFKRHYKLQAALFELTLRCNMQCIHCGSSAGDQRVKELTTDEWLKVVKDLSDTGCKYITLLGGEPFLRKDWFEISKGIKENDMKLTIISNGFLIDNDVVSKLKELDLYTLAISLDGASPETHDKIRQVKGSFEKCVNVLERLKEAGIKTSVITTLNKINYEDLPMMRSLLLDKGVAWQIQIAAPIGRFPKELMLSKEEFYSVALFISATRKKYSI